jgi:hypothetical protein
MHPNPVPDTARNEMGFLIYFFVFGAFWLTGTGVYIVRAYLRALRLDPVIYQNSRPPTLRRFLMAASFLTSGTAFFTSIVFEEYFVGHRPLKSDFAAGRIYPLMVHGATVYLTKQERVLASQNWMLVAITCFLIFFTIKREGDPFADKFEGAPVCALPKSVFEQASSPPSYAPLVMLATYFAALLALIAFLIVRAFARH